MLPSAVPEDKKEVSERILVRHAKSQDAKFVKHIGRGIADHLNPDGLFDENDRARRRGLNLGPQGPDGMSHLSGWIDPELRAYLEAANAAVRPVATNPTPTNTKRSNPIREVRRNGYTTPSNSGCAPASPRANSVNTADCRSPSSSPRH